MSFVARPLFSVPTSPRLLLDGDGDAKARHVGGAVVGVGVERVRPRAVPATLLPAGCDCVIVGGDLR
jgi:hypothetical protein